MDQQVSWELSFLTLSFNYSVFFIVNNFFGTNELVSAFFNQDGCYKLTKSNPQVTLV